jgi:hypothetical protein
MNVFAALQQTAFIHAMPPAFVLHLHLLDIRHRGLALLLGYRPPEGWLSFL